MGFFLKINGEIMLKKTALIVLGLTASGFASAGTMGPVCVPGDVTVPCEARHWDIGVQALYFRPTYTADRGYELNATNGLSLANGLPNGFNYGYRKNEPEWDWGYRIEGSYHFNTGNDVTLTLIRFDNGNTRYGFRGFTDFSAATLPYDLNLSNRFDQLNILLGQHVDMSAAKKIRFYGGFQYAKIRLEETREFTVVPAALLRQRASGLAQYNKSEVYGFGPTLGIDYSYNLFLSGLSVTANGATSLLTGISRFANGYVVAPTGLVRFNDSFTRKVVVPSFEAKLGLKYEHEFTNGALSLEGGYQAINYFDVFKARGRVSTQPSTTNFGLYGPYFGAKWVGNV